MLITAGKRRYSQLVNLPWMTESSFEGPCIISSIPGKAAGEGSVIVTAF